MHKNKKDKTDWTKAFYYCPRCRFSHRFPLDIFEEMDPDAITSLRRCPGCRKRMDRINGIKIKERKTVK